MVDDEGGQQELVVCIPENVLGLDPATGKEFGSCDGGPDCGYVCLSVVAHDGTVYAIGGRKNTALAGRVGGRGDVIDSQLSRKTGKGSNASAPAYHQGYVDWVHDRSGAAYFFFTAFFLAGLAAALVDLLFDFLAKMLSQFLENSGLAPERTIGPLISNVSFSHRQTAEMQIERHNHESNGSRALL